MKTFFIILQYLAPQHLLSRLLGRAANASTAWLKNIMIRNFIHTYDVNMDEALLEQPEEYTSFNDFFTRALKADARPIADEHNAIVSPADGTVSAIGDIAVGSIFQAKGKMFSLVTLLGGSQERARPFLDGRFSTVYLAPKDYHRVHMPCAGTLREMIYIPGKLFSVNRTTTERIPGLFSRNERVVCLFDTDAGPMALVLVGAMIVASVETVWAGTAAPAGKEIRETDYRQHQPVIQLDKGQEMGRFKLGSTVIVLFGPGNVDWAKQLQANNTVKMGERIGSFSKF